MSANFFGELLIRVKYDDAQLTSGLTKSAAGVKSLGSKFQNLERVGLGMQNIGRTMTQFVTLPIVAAGAASVYMAVKFDQSMRKVQTLAGASEAQMKTYRAAIESIGPATAQGPTQLADALYFIVSAGYKGQKAIDLLGISAKASAIGMGDAKVVANALTSVIKAYSGSGLTAAKAMDIMTETVVKGKMAVTDLIPALGRILPIADGMHASFVSLGAVMADMTRQGLPVTQAVTGLRQIMMAIAAPTDKAKKNADALGLSFTDLQKTVKDKGLVAALMELYKATGNNVSKMKDLGMTQRAIPAYMALIHNHGIPLIQMFKDMGGATGALNTAMEQTRQTISYKFHDALVSLEYAGIKIGAALLPTVTKLVTIIGEMGAAFTRLSPGTQSFLLWAAAITAAMGPVLMVFGSAARSVGLLGGAFAKMAAARSAAKVASTVTSFAAEETAAGEAAGAAWGIGFTAAVALPIAAAVAAGLWVLNSPASKRAQQIQASGVSNAGRAAGSFANQAQTNAAIAADTKLKATTAANAPLLQKVTIQAQDATGPAFKSVIDRYESIKQLTRQGISLKVDTTSKATTLSDLRSIEARIMGTGQSAKSAYAEMKTVFGGDFLKPFKAQLLGLPSAWGNAAKGAKSAGAKGGKDLADGIRSSTGDIRSAAAQAAAAAKIKTGDLHGVGQQLGNSLADGMQAAVNHVRIAALDLANAAVVPVRQQTQTNSPSKVFMAMGKDFSLGLAHGMSSGKSDVVASAIDVAKTIVESFRKAFGSKASKTQLADASTESGSVGTLLDFVNSITTALTTLAGSTVPTLSAGWKQSVIKVVKQADDLSKFIAAQITKAFPYTKGTKKTKTQAAVAPTAGAAGQRVIDAADTSGSISTLLDFVNNISVALTTLSTATFPALAAGVKAKVKTLAAVAVDMAKTIASAIESALPKMATSGTGKHRKTGPNPDYTNVLSAADGAGAITTLLDFINNVDAAITTLSTSKIPALTDDIKAKVQTIAGQAIKLAKIISDAITGVVIPQAVSDNSSRVAGLVNDITGIITSLVSMTADTVDRAKAGILLVINAAPALGANLVKMVDALHDALMKVGSSADFAATGPVATAVNSFVGDVTGIISSLAGMAIIPGVDATDTTAAVPMVDIVQNGIDGANNVAGRATELGTALGGMVSALVGALGSVGLSQLTDMQPVLDALNNVASAISGIVSALATITADQITAAGAGGAALGNGFLTGLISTETAIYDEARRIVSQTASILAGSTGPASSGGTGGVPTGASDSSASAGIYTVVNDNSQRTFQITVYPQYGSMSDAEMKSLWSRLDQLDRDAGVAAARAALA